MRTTFIDTPIAIAEGITAHRGTRTAMRRNAAAASPSAAAMTAGSTTARCSTSTPSSDDKEDDTTKYAGLPSFTTMRGGTASGTFRTPTSWASRVRHTYSTLYQPIGAYSP